MTTRRLVIVIATTSIVLALPLIAPYPPALAHRGFPLAPPMLTLGDGWPVPMVQPLRREDPIENIYLPDGPPVAVWSPWTAAPPPPLFLLGADGDGRDVLSRLLAGARLSLGLAILSTALTLTLGAAVGAWAGYRGGWVDDLLMRTADLLLVIPLLYVVLVLRTLLPLAPPSSVVFAGMAGIFTMVSWPIVARGVRAIVSAERSREYVLAARSLGASPSWLVARHLLPACADFLAGQAVLLVPAFILAEASLSFVGFGFSSDVATWGTMLVEARNVSALLVAPWLLAPAVAIFAVTLMANLMARRLRGDAGAVIVEPSSPALGRGRPG